MRFFVPLSNSPTDGERLYETIRNRLQETKEPTAARRIYVLKFQEDGKRRTIAVGDEFHRLADGPNRSHLSRRRHLGVLRLHAETRRVRRRALRNSQGGRRRSGRILGPALMCLLPLSLRRCINTPG